jgi:hypothetical protein
MAEGTGTYNGLGVPILGESEITQQTAATDIVTLTGATSQTGDFLVCQIAAGTEVLVVDVSGNVDSAGQVECASLAVTGIGTVDFASHDAGTATFAVTGLTSSDVVLISPREDTDGAIVVDKVSSAVLQLRNVASEGANVEINYLVISKT